MNFSFSKFFRSNWQVISLLAVVALSVSFVYVFYVQASTYVVPTSIDNRVAQADSNIEIEIDVGQSDGTNYDLNYYSASTCQAGDSVADSGASLKGVIKLKEFNASGDNVAFSATLASTSDKTTITINPTNTLEDGLYYVELAPLWYASTAVSGNCATATFGTFFMTFEADGTPPSTDGVVVTFAGDNQLTTGNEDDAFSIPIQVAGIDEDVAFARVTITDSGGNSISTGTARFFNHKTTLDNTNFTGSNKRLSSVATYDGSQWLVGAAGNDDGNVYLIEDKNNDGDYTDSGEITNVIGTYLHRDQTDFIYSNFGRSVAMSSTTLYIGDGNGRVHVLADKNGDGDYATTSGEYWVISSTTNGLGDYNIASGWQSSFGWSLAIWRDKLVVGEHYQDNYKGRVFVLEDKNGDGDYSSTTGEVWLIDATNTEDITFQAASGGNSGSHFGAALSATGSKLYVSYIGSKRTVYRLEDKNDDQYFATTTGEIYAFNNDTNSAQAIWGNFGSSSVPIGRSLFVSAPSYNFYYMEDKNNDGDYGDGVLVPDVEFKSFGVSDLDGISGSDNLTHIGLAYGAGEFWLTSSGTRSLYIFDSLYRETPGTYGSGFQTSYFVSGINLLSPRLGHGNLTLTTVIKDAVGNQATVTSYAFYGNDAPPTDLDLASADDTGISNTDNVTSQTSNLTITGCATSSADVQLFNGANPIGDTVVANGSTGCTSPLKQFTKDITLTAGYSFHYRFFLSE